MTELRTQNDDYVNVVKDSFSKQTIMHLIGAELVDVTPGFCSIELCHREDLCQQDGFFHAGVISIIADSAGGYAAFSLMRPNSRVLTVEFKINLLRPAAGHSIFAKGEVIRAGKNLSFTEVKVYVRNSNKNTLCANMTQTLACVDDTIKSA
jgi:uncharacterized protein (TIGR00369 family)